MGIDDFEKKKEMEEADEDIQFFEVHLLVLTLFDWHFFVFVLGLKGFIHMSSTDSNEPTTLIIRPVTDN